MPATKSKNAKPAKAKAPATKTSKVLKAKPAAPPKKMSALDAAAQVLSGGAMTTKELIEAMAAEKLWESPNGKTPAATLYAAILREITTKGAASRFQKTAPGTFAATGAAAEVAIADETRVPAARAAKPKTVKGGRKPAAKHTTPSLATEEAAPGAPGTDAAPAA